MSVPPSGPAPRRERSSSGPRGVQEIAVAPRHAARAVADVPSEPVGGAGAPLLAAFTSVAGILGAAGFPPASWGAAATAIRAVFTVAFWVLAPGAAIVSAVSLRTATRVALVPITGTAVTIAVGAVSGWTGLWYPRSITVAVAAVVLVASALLRRRLRRVTQPPGVPWTRRVAGHRPNASQTAVCLLLAASLISWIIALRRASGAAPSVLGLLISGPRTLPLAIALCAVALLVALRSRGTVLVAACTTGLLLCFRATGTIVDPVPMPTWSYKHVGVVSAIEAHGHILSGSDIYMNWPGMFAATGLVHSASGAPILELARWITPLISVVLALAVFALTDAIGCSRAGAAAAAALVVVFNWVGQDYFSPQAVAICLAAGVVLTAIQARTSRACAGLSVALFAVTVCTHQLTPFWLWGVAVALLILRRVPWWVPAAMTVLLIAYVAPRYGVVARFGLFSGFDPVSNATVSVPDIPGSGRVVAGYFSKAAAGLMWLSTLAVLLQRARRAGWRGSWGRLDIVPIGVVAFSAFALLGGQAYGGEAILRVTLYSTIGCSVVLGPALARLLQRSLPAAAAATVWLGTVIAIVAQASFGPWFINYVRSEDVATARWLAAHAPSATVIAVANDWPGREFVNYVEYNRPGGPQDESLPLLLQESVPPGARPPTGSLPLRLGMVEHAVAGTAAGAGNYLVFTKTMQSYSDYYRTYPPGRYQALLRDVERSASWQVVFRERSDFVFRYNASP